MPGEQREVLSGAEVQPTPETPEMRSIRQRLDKAAERARSVQRACSGDDPHLGLATTEELIVELHARMEVCRVIGQPMRLDYRTIDGDAPDPKEEPRG
jgi:hypothetical protein